MYDELIKIKKQKRLTSNPDSIRYLLDFYYNNIPNAFSLKMKNKLKGVD